MNEATEPIVLPVYPQGYRLQVQRLQLRALAEDDAPGAMAAGIGRSSHSFSGMGAAPLD